MDHNVQFEEDTTMITRSHDPGSSGMIGFLIKKGIVKDVQTANMILIAAVVFCVLFIGFLIFFAGEEPLPELPPDMLT